MTSDANTRAPAGGARQRLPWIGRAIRATAPWAGDTMGAAALFLTLWLVLVAVHAFGG